MDFAIWIIDGWRIRMVHVTYIDNDTDNFETKKNSEPWKWIPDQKAYLIPSIEGNVIIPSAFVKRLKHYDVDLED